MALRWQREKTPACQPSKQAHIKDIGLPGRWRRDTGPSEIVRVEPLDAPGLEDVLTSGGAHLDPKINDVMIGPGIAFWRPLDGKQARHCDPWGPGSQHQDGRKAQHTQRSSQLTVRQGQGIEEALSNIGAQAGERQERPREGGYCPAGEANFRSLGSNPFTVDKRKPSEASTSAQLRNQRRARRRAKERDVWSDPTSKHDHANGGCVVLVRDDCRLHDNPALYHASTSHAWIVALYIHDVHDPSPFPVRGAALYWRHMSLEYFGRALVACKGRLTIRIGSYVDEVVDVLLSSQAGSVYFNRQLEPWYYQRDLDLERAAADLGLRTHSFKGLVLQREPWELQAARPPPQLLTKYQGTPTKSLDGDRDDTDDPYFWPLHAAAAESGVEDPLPTVTHLGEAPRVESLPLEALGYSLSAGKGIPRSMVQHNETRERQLRQGSIQQDQANDWAFEMRKFWRFGEDGALAQLEDFLVVAAAGHYQPPERYRADKLWTALLSPYLRFGDLSARYVYSRARQVLPFSQWKPLVRRLFWRDGAYAQLYRWPSSPQVSIRSQYETEQWSGTQQMLKRWQRGSTGFPLIDAAMRQLWKVGLMPNYLRHVTAQFLIEYLDISWKSGFQWFDYTLVDSDVAINAMMWQMGGHSGLGAWNFVMHPVFAGKKVDPEGHYVRHWLPALRDLPVEYIHCPWEAPCALLLSANVLLSRTYHERVFENLVGARRAHARNVIAVRRRFPELVAEDGHEILEVGEEKIAVRVRDDLKDNSENITLEMTPDDAHSMQRRRLLHTRGLHNQLIFDEAKR